MIKSRHWKDLYSYLVFIEFSDGMGTLNPGFGYFINGFRQVKQGFSSIFAILDDFSKWNLFKYVETFDKKE